MKVISKKSIAEMKVDIDRKKITETEEDILAESTMEDDDMSFTM